MPESLIFFFSNLSPWLFSELCSYLKWSLYTVELESLSSIIFLSDYSIYSFQIMPLFSTVLFFDLVETVNLKIKGQRGNKHLFEVKNNSYSGSTNSGRNRNTVPVVPVR